MPRMHRTITLDHGCTWLVNCQPSPRCHIQLHAGSAGKRLAATHMCSVPARMPHARPHAMYKLAANTTSRLIAALAACICWNSDVLPITRAASISSRHAWSSRTTARTIEPSITSVSPQMASNGVPRAHSYTTCESTNEKGGGDKAVSPCMASRGGGAGVVAPALLLGAGRCRAPNSRPPALQLFKAV
eukprot:354461-Chlamydomonas_euryale.AAC.9